MREWLEELQEDPCPNGPKQKLIMKILAWLKAEKFAETTFDQPARPDIVSPARPVAPQEKKKT